MLRFTYTVFLCVTWVILNARGLYVDTNSSVAPTLVRNLGLLHSSGVLIGSAIVSLILLANSCAYDVLTLSICYTARVIISIYCTGKCFSYNKRCFLMPGCCYLHIVIHPQIKHVESCHVVLQHHFPFIQWCADVPHCTSQS